MINQSEWWRNWDGKLAGVMDAIHARMDAARVVRDRRGCCGNRHEIEVNDYAWEDGRDRFIGRWTVVRCGVTHDECKGWVAELLTQCWRLRIYQEDQEVSMAEQRGLITQDAMKRAREFESILKQTQDEVRMAEDEGNDTLKAMIQAQGLGMLKDTLTDDVMGVIRRMEGSPLGYKTDRDSSERGRYSNEEIRDALIEGRLRGFRFVGNEINVIGGNFYATQAGLRRIINDHPGIANLKLSPSRPMFAKLPDGKLDENVKCVSYVASFKFNPNWRDAGKAEAWQDEQIVCDIVRDAAGKPIRDERIPVKLNRGMGDDAVVGKATRKMLQRIYTYLSQEHIRSAEDVEEIAAVYTVEENGGTDEQGP